MTRKIFLIAAVLLVALAPAAAGQGYSGSSQTLTIEDTLVSPGDGNSSEVTGCEPGTTVTWSTTQDGNTVQLGTTTCGDDGTSTLDWTVPESFVPGEATLSATVTPAVSDAATAGDAQFAAAGTTTTLSVNYDVVEADGDDGTDATVTTLPRTGSSLTGPLLRTGVVLVTLGGLVLLAVRRRNQGATA